MSQLRFEPFITWVADVGAENPLPPLMRSVSSNAPELADPAIPAEDRKYLGYGAGPPILPYRMQDGFGRGRRQQAVRTAVLENDRLRARFLLDYGGRLWSLYDKAARRELLHVNPVIQPTHLAYRGAWFSGGVEWNMSVIGHCPFTCAPLFAAAAQDERGTPVLRMYEWERVRGLFFQIDAYLPEGLPYLLVRVRLINPHEHEVPTYWFSNISVPESAGHRVLVPADWAMSFSYRGALARVPIPTADGVDTSYATNIRAANDFFYRIPDGRRAWITSLDAQGRGVIQTSTARLQGRKLFVWGMAPGGRRWQEFLTQPGGEPYVEIQAGLGRTQAECVPMPGGSDWSWLEAYGLMEADARKVHGSDWWGAVENVEERLEQRLPRAWMEAELARTATMADRVPDQVIAQGSGWGALEEMRRQRRGGGAAARSTGIVFDPSTLGPEQAPWLALLERGELPYGPPSEPPASWMIQKEWRDLLEDALAHGRGDHYLSWLHVGVMRWAADDVAGARQAWEKSLAREESAWAWRNLAVLARDHEKDATRAAELWIKAWRLQPAVAALAIESCKALLAAGRARDVLGVLAELPREVREHSRVRLLGALARLELGDFAAVESVLASDLEVADLREGELSITDLWFAYHEKRIGKEEGAAMDEALRQRVHHQFPVPRRFDFGMSGG